MRFARAENFFHSARFFRIAAGEISEHRKILLAGLWYSSRVMIHLTRRQFGGIVLLGTQAQRLFGASGSASAIDRTLREGIERRKIPCVAAMVASQDKILYSGAFGKRDLASGIDDPARLHFPDRFDDQGDHLGRGDAAGRAGKLKLDEPVARHLPQLAKLT